MAIDRQVIVHKRSSDVNSGQPKSPSVGILEKGEIAVNYNDSTPSLFIESASGNIVRFVDKTYTDNALLNKEDKSSKVSAITSGSTDIEYPSAKAVYTNLKENKNEHVHVISKDDVTVTTDTTKGVSPYNTSYGYTNIVVNTLLESDIISGTKIILCCGGSLIVSSSYRNVRLKFGSEGSWIPVFYTTSIAGGSTYLINGACTMLVYRNDIYSGGTGTLNGAFHIFYDVNSTYSNPAAFGIGYGTCTTAEATIAKTVTLSSYALQTNGIVSVKFTYAVPASATMNINGKGAKAIYYKGSAITAGVVKAGDIVTFIYDGSHYHLLAIDSDITGKVDKVEGKGLSTNDYTTEEKTKLSGIASEATKVNESTVSGWGFTKNSGTITGIKMNGSSKGTSGVVDLGTVITSHQDISGKVDKIDGKGLSTNDYTTEEKTKLTNLKGVDVVDSSSSTIDDEVKIWIDTSKNYGELDPTQVVQSTGQSTTNVMSQKAVTDELNDKLNIQQSSSDYGKPIIVGEDGKLYADYHKYLHSINDVDGLTGALANKMSTLNAGTGIQIVNNTISCTVSSGTVDLTTMESNVSSLNDATFDISSNVGTKESGKMYNYDNNTISSFGGTCSCTTVLVEEGAEYYASTSMMAQSTCFPLITYFASDGTRLGYEYMNPSDVEIKIVDKKLNLPDNTAYFYMNSRYITWEKVDIKTSKIKNLRDDMYDYVEIEPEETMTGKLYYYSGNRMATVSDGRVYKIAITEGTRYYITSSIIGNDTGFPIVSFFDSSDNQLGYQFMNQPSVQLDIIDQLITVPEDTAYMYVNARGMDAIINGYVSKISGGASKKEIKILFVGNSLTQDGIAYLPYMLKIYYPEIKFKIYMWYNGGYTLAEHYNKFINNQACEIFSIAENNSTWTNTNMTMANILSTYQFDIVSLQEYFNYKSSYTESDLTDWNNCRNYIRDNYTGSNPLKFVSLFHAPKRSSAETIYNLTKSGNDLILSKTISQGILPNGVAVYKALSTSLDSLGDQGHLSPDGTHTQEGLPCLLQTYVALLWVFRELGINKSIYNHSMRMTTEIYNTINVPGPNLGTGVITGTDAENILAQEVAIMAFKEYYPL